MKNGYSVFVVSFVSAALFTFFERLLGLKTGFHPDSLYYLTNYEIYVLNIDTIFLALNNFYFYVVYNLNGNEELLITLNWILFGATNVIIFKFVGKKINPVVLILMFLPYRLHLSAHILKDTFIILLCLLPFIARSWWSAPISFVLAGFRIPAVPPMLFARFIPLNARVVVLSLASIVLAVFTFDVLYVFLLDRASLEMEGRDFFAIPLADASSIQDIVLRSFVWPLLYKTGGYAIVSPSPVLFGLAAEQLLLLIVVLRAGLMKEYFFSRGTLALVVYALVVSSFGAYYRYGYAFYMLDAMFIAKMWNIRFHAAQETGRDSSTPLAIFRQF